MIAAPGMTTINDLWHGATVLRPTTRNSRRIPAHFLKTRHNLTLMFGTPSNPQPSLYEARRYPKHKRDGITTRFNLRSKNLFQTNDLSILLRTKESRPENTSLASSYLHYLLRFANTKRLTFLQLDIWKDVLLNMKLGIAKNTCCEFLPGFRRITKRFYLDF